MSLTILLLLFATTSCEDGEGSGEIPASETYDYIVAKDGSGDFTTVQEAFDAVKFIQTARTYIFIRNGIYKEVLRLEENKNKITLIGEDPDQVYLTFDNYASKINPETNKEYGTSGSSSTFIYGDSFYARNITFENSSGPVGQALAMYINGDKAVFENCRFIGHQDTFYGGRSRQYFINCYIEGTTDFIFGPSTAFFESCELYTMGGSAITAASTENYVEFGYVFRNCSIAGNGAGITTLGRPWRPYAAVAFLNTSMTDCIKPEGWNNWGDPSNESTARYEEFQNSGAGATPDQRPDWITQLSSPQASIYTVKNVFKTTYSDPPVVDNWDPEADIEIVDEYLTKIK